MAIVADDGRRRIYLPPDAEHEIIAQRATPVFIPDQPLARDPRNVWCVNYGLDHFNALYTNRQLVALRTHVDLVRDVRREVRADGGSDEYADAVTTYLAFAVDKMADANSVLCTWQTDPPRLRATFGRQALPMTWDYAEANVFGDAAGDFQRSVGSVCEVLERLEPAAPAQVGQLDATKVASQQLTVVCTDPPYYDNISYADLSDYFYVWLREALADVYPDLFSTLLTPKTSELVATPYRFEGNKREAERFFEQGLGDAFSRIRERQDPEFPLTIFYAFKQAEVFPDGSGLASTGWETMLSGLLKAGFEVTGTWPMRSEMATRNVGRGTNALASSIVLVCRPRAENAALTTRRDFLSSLRTELPTALRSLQEGNIAPVDLAQAAIGPGMAVFSRYARVVEADGSSMAIRTALSLINATLDEILAEQESDFDPDTRFAIAWFEQYGTDAGPFGEADVLARAKNTSVHGLEIGGIVTARGGKLILLGKEALDASWTPAGDSRLTVWEATHQLMRILESDGEISAAALLKALGGVGEAARELAYRLYAVSERRNRSQEALSYNALVSTWPELVRLAAEPGVGVQAEMEM